LEDSKVAILKQIDKEGGELFKNVSDLAQRKLMANHFDDKPWNRLFTVAEDAVKQEAFTVLKQYDGVVSGMKQA